jgi:excisionase family DNA binding protein
MNADDLFTAPQVAKICSTDLKTIHNWVNRGEIKSFRTPGRHLRFRRQDILEFLNRFGYPIPDGFSPSRKRVILCDSSESMRRSLKRTLSRDFEVEAFGDHVDALLAFGKQRPDLLLVNGGDGDEMIHLVEKLSSGKNASLILVYGPDNAKGKFRNNSSIEYVASSDSKEVRKGVIAILSR